MGFLTVATYDFTAIIAELATVVDATTIISMVAACTAATLGIYFAWSASRFIVAKLKGAIRGR